MRSAAQPLRFLRGTGPGLWRHVLMVAILVVPIVSFASIRTAKAKVVKTDDTPSKVVITAKLVITNDDRAKAGDIFKEKCATCHGDDGRGNGPAAANLK